MKAPNHDGFVPTARTDHGVVRLDEPAMTIKGGGNTDGTRHHLGGAVPPAVSLDDVYGTVVDGGKTKMPPHRPINSLDEPATTQRAQHGGGGSGMLLVGGPNMAGAERVLYPDGTTSPVAEFPGRDEPAPTTADDDFADLMLLTGYVERLVANHDLQPLSLALAARIDADATGERALPALRKHRPVTPDEPSRTVEANIARGGYYGLVETDGRDAADGRAWESRHPPATPDDAAPVVQALAPRAGTSGWVDTTGLDAAADAVQASAPRSSHPPVSVRLRRLTVRECARLQDFPDDFVFHGAKTHQYRMVGNAAPPGLIEPVARAIRAALEAAKHGT